MFEDYRAAASKSTSIADDARKVRNFAEYSIHNYSMGQRRTHRSLVASNFEFCPAGDTMTGEAMTSPGTKIGYCDDNSCGRTANKSLGVRPLILDGLSLW